MEIIITPRAQKQYQQLPKTDLQKIKKKLLVLEKKPFEGKKLSGELAGQYSVRVWPYRVIYYINPKLQKIFVTSIAHRQGVYK